MDITVLPRGKQTKGERKRRSRQGYVPGAIYGRGVEPKLVEVSAKFLTSVLLADSGLNTPLSIGIEGERGVHSAIVDNLERHPITRAFLSVGFHQIQKGDKVHAQIPIRLVGTPIDVAINGALLEQTMDSIDVMAQPKDLPAHLDVDVSHLKVGDVVRVQDLPHSKALVYSSQEDLPIAAVHVSTVAQQVAAAEETAPVSPDTPTEAAAGADSASSTEAA